MSGLVEEDRHELVRLAAEESVQKADLGHGVIGSTSVSTISGQIKNELMITKKKITKRK
jgi:hypothetical protein